MQLLSPSDEKARYDTHKYHLNDPGQFNFLNSLVTKVIFNLSRSKEKTLGLDFGCGAQGLMSEIFAQEGIKQLNYDLYYFPGEDVWYQGPFDFITACEVVEHLRDPMQDFKRMLDALRPKGVLAIRTGIEEAHRPFADWYYIKDQTHINFYNQHTCEWIANYFSLDLVHFAKDGIVWIKNK